MLDNSRPTNKFFTCLTIKIFSKFIIMNITNLTLKINPKVFKPPFSFSNFYTKFIYLHNYHYEKQNLFLMFMHIMYHRFYLTRMVCFKVRIFSMKCHPHISLSRHWGFSTILLLSIKSHAWVLLLIIVNYRLHKQ